MEARDAKANLIARYILKTMLYHYIYPSIKLLAISMILLDLIGSIGSAIVYSDFDDDIFCNPIFAFENGWISGADATGNSFLTTNSILCGQKTSFSVVVNYDARKSITFNWEKIGTNANLLCYYDNITNIQYSRICNSHNWAPERITIPPGRHIVTWELSVAPCNGGPGSVASIDNINIPESIHEINCTIQTNDNVVIGQESIASLPFSGNDATYDWQISSGGIIKSSKPYINRIIWKATKIGETEIKASVISRNGSCTNTTKCKILERQTLNITDDMDLNDIISKSENKILLLNDGEYSDEIIIRVKNLKIASKNRYGAIFDNRGANYSIVLDNTSDVSVEGLNLTDCSGGFIIYNSTDCIIKNNSILSKKKPGIFIDSSSSNIIANNILRFNSSDKDQGIRLNNSRYNIIDNNSILTDAYLFLVDLESNSNMIKHDFSEFPGIIFNFNDKTNCSIDCSKHDKHKIKCPNDSENRRDCIKCVSCDKIGTINNWTCIL